MAQLEALMQRNFLEYSSYFVLDRAIPELRDGLKPVQRRIPLEAMAIQRLPAQ